MKLNQIEEQSFALAVLCTYDISGLGIDTTIAQNELKEELISEINDLNSEKTKQARLEYFKVPGVNLSDYSEKLLSLNNGKKVIYGIRNFGGDPKLPFIQIIPNFEITSKKVALDIYQSIKDQFNIFNPLYLGFQTKDKIDADFFGSTFMVASSKEIKKINPWDFEKKIEFETINDSSYYDWYKNGYDEFHKEVPELKEKVTVNSLESMTDSQEQGLLKFVSLNGERIGLIAGEREKFLGHDGLYFHEIFISAKWKKKGLAKAIQRKFICNFTDGHEYIWGTIDSFNIPSYKTAYSNKRRPIRHECFINIR